MKSILILIEVFSIAALCIVLLQVLAVTIRAYLYGSEKKLIFNVSKKQAIVSIIAISNIVISGILSNVSQLLK